MARKKVRYAVVGLGHIAQVAVLPAFKHASKNSELTAFVSDTPRKLEKLASEYGVRNLYSYEEYGECLSSGQIDAVYIALPNHLHREYAVRAAQAGIHILCEKPMAVTSRECEAMIRAAEKNNVRLMIAYRLHFDDANLTAAKIARSGKIGDLRQFNSLFTMNVRQGDIRLGPRELGGGTLYDIGIYCINAARYLFRDEPVEVSAVTARSEQRRFRDSEEMASVTLRFPGERLASFTCAFGSSDTDSFQLAGTKGDIRLAPAYSYTEKMELEVTVDGKTSTQTFSRSDQFAPELLHFSDCILRGRKPEPSGVEGLIDVRIIEALYRSARTGRPQLVKLPSKTTRPTLRQEKKRPPVRKPKLVAVKPPSK